MCPHFFQAAIFHEKRGLEVQNFLIFLIHYRLSENQKKIWFFTLFWGDLEGVGTLCPPALKLHSNAHHHKG